MSLFGGLSTTTNTAEASGISSRRLDCEDLPHFLYAQLVNKDEVGYGEFSSVFTAGFPTSGEKAAVKIFIGDEEIHENILIKEAKLFNSLQLA